MMTSAIAPIGVYTPICGARSATFPGPRLYTTTRPEGLLHMNCQYGSGDGVHLTGFRLQGPDWGEDVGGSTNLERGIYIESCNGVEIDDMELSGWADAAIRVIDPAGRRQNGPGAVRVHDSFFHHNQHTGEEGYGVDVSLGGWAQIQRNVFDHNRHAVTHGLIASADGGYVHMGGYIADQNLVLKGGGYNGNPFQEHVQQFDVHGDGNCPFGSNFYNCGNSGESYLVTNNAFQFTLANSFLLRGTPLYTATVSGNVFARSLGDAVGTAGWGVSGLLVTPENQAGTDSYSHYGVCDMDGDGYDDLFLATGNSWWMMSAAKQSWVFLNAYDNTIDRIALGDFQGTGRCDVFAEQNGEWLLSSGGSGAWQSLGHVGVPFDQLRFGHFTDAKRMEMFRRAPDGQWSLISPGFFDWTPLNSSSLPLSQLHFGNFNGKGTTDVVANVNGHWSMSVGGRCAWQPLNPTLSDSLDGVHIADLDGKGTDDIVRGGADGNWQVSVGGRTAWQPLVSAYGLPCCFFGNFEATRGVQMLGITLPEEAQFTAPDAKIRLSAYFPTASDDYRRSLLFRRANGAFTPYGKYSY
jgi:hypothetical protein